MMAAKWKFLIASIVAYQFFLTWCLFDLVDTAAYLARPECGDWCRDRAFGFILTNQGGYDTAMRVVIFGGVLTFTNVAFWIVASIRKKR
ncbi:hypothetical protein GRI39_11975 [Altererythrobacter indicus]|uniref:Uncharacterized protein n=1 Tax=Altericroceibacterium indicum TaxID=374177 RepID=A0A845ABY1_9SPHN|nr:hypothetical protein [Altericroceibacterium indicum]MXP26753.1 hypothetical protein [Altericroceibacterium indicum]